MISVSFSSVCGDELQSHAGSGSGGYLHHVFTFAAKQLFGEEVKELTYKTLRCVNLRGKTSGLLDLAWLNLSKV